MRKKIKIIKNRADAIKQHMEQAVWEGDKLDGWVRDIVILSDECLAILNGVEFDLLELLRKIRQ